MKVLKNVSLIFFIGFMSCAISNWGNDLTRNPVVVCTGFIISITVFALTSAFEDL